MAAQHAQGSQLGDCHYQSFRIEVYQDIVRSYLSEGHASLGLIVVGEAGQGKSSLINGLLGKQLAKEGYDLDPETQEITKYEFVQNGVAVVLWDTPGFGMESDEREEALQAMAAEWAGEDPIDLMLYCIRMDGARWPKKTDITTIRKITEFFGPNIWQCCQFVLTFANQVMGLRCPPGQEPEQFFSSKVESFENKVRETLMKHAHLTEEAVEQVCVVPVGDPHQSHDRSWKLPSIDDWFVNFWLECSCRIRQSALPTLINLNKHRTTYPAQDESSLNPPDPSTQLYEHSLPSSALDLDSLETPGLALTVPPDQCPTSAESSPMPSLVQSSENSSVALAADHKLAGRHDFRTRNDIELSLPADYDDSPGDKTPEAAHCKESLKDRKISTYRTLYHDLKNKKSGFREYIKIYWEQQGKEIPGFGHIGGLLEALFQWLECSVILSSKSVEFFNIEEKPHQLIRATEEVEELKGLADEMLTQNRANEGQLTGVNVVDERVFKLEGRRAQPLLWEEHGFRMFIPEDALLPYETCHVSVKAIVGGRFQFPEGTEPVSAVYAISLSRQLLKPARMEMQHCVNLENPEHSKSMSFAVASQDPSSMPYQFYEVSGGIFEENKFFGSVDRHQFSFMTIIWKLLGYDIKCMYSASTFTQKAKMDEQLWILAVSKDLDTMKRYLTSSLKEAEQEIEEVTFEFEKEEITLEILDEATPGWIIEPLITPCTITRRQVESRVQPHNIEHGPIVCKVRIAFENPSRPPYEVLRNRIRLDGISPERYFNIHFIPPLLRTDSNGSASRRALLSSVSSSSSSFTCSFDSPPSLDSVVPTQRDFYKMVILKIPTKWKTFGIMLEIDIERLEGILQDKKNSEDCFLEVYRVGKMELDQQFTWKRVLDILQNDLKENSLRNRIQDKLLQEKVLDSVVEAS